METEKTKKNRTALLFWLVIGLAALACAAVVFARMDPKAVRGTVNVYVGDELYGSYPVSVPKKLTIEGEDGAVNVIEIDGSGVRMLSSTCKNQVCVNTGRIAADDPEGLDLNNWIVCLPNRVSVELAEE